MIKESKYVAVLLVISATFASQAAPSGGNDEPGPLDQVVPVAIANVGIVDRSKADA